LISALIVTWSTLSPSCVRYNRVWEVWQGWVLHIMNRMRCLTGKRIAAFIVQKCIPWLWKTRILSGSPVVPIKVCCRQFVYVIWPHYHKYFHMYISYYNVIPRHLRLFKLVNPVFIPVWTVADWSHFWRILNITLIAPFKVKSDIVISHGHFVKLP